MPLPADPTAVFGAAADTYARARPTYPEAAIDWLIPDGARRVLDLGAGTGKLTAALVARGLEVTAVEPSDGMRDELARHLPGVRALAGRAEEIPLPDGAVDAVLVAQAWHWVDLPRAVPEVARVLRPGGQLGLVWNTRDDRVAWVAEYGRILHVDGAQRMDTAAPLVGPPFGAIERHDVAWEQALTAEGLVQLAASRSYVISSSEADRTALLERVRRLTVEHPALRDADRFALPYVTECSRTRLPG